MLSHAAARSGVDQGLSLRWIQSSDGAIRGERSMSAQGQLPHSLNSTVVWAGILAAGWAPLTLAQTAATSTDAAAGPEEVVVTGQREHYRGDVPVEELPQAVQVISGELLQEVGAVRLNDALDLAAGVARQNTFGGAWDSFAIRGFAGDINVPSGYLINGFNGARGFGGIRDTSAIEKIEVLKGPGSALFGRGEPGGTVAITTKKPQWETQGSVAVAAGSDNFQRAEGDFTTPLGDAVAIRITGAAEEADSFRDTLSTKRYFASPSILARIGDDTSISYELEWSDQEIPFDRGVVARNNVLGIVPNSRFLGEPGDGPMTAKVLGHQLELQQNFAGTWALLVGAAYRETELKGFGQSPELAATRQPFFTDGQTLSRQRRFTDYESTDLVTRAEVSGSFNTGSLTHHLLFGADYEEFELDHYQTRYRPPVFAPGATLATLNAVNIFNPAYGFLATPNAFVFNDVEEQTAYGVYLTDQIDVTDQWKFRLGGRYDWFKQSIADELVVLQPPEQDVTAFSPQAGIIYQPTDTLTFYAAYAKGFRPNTGFDIQRRPFEPEETESYEVGMKWASLDEKLRGTIAVYTMEKTNVITADPLNAGFSVAIGEAKSKGVELELSGDLPAQFRVQASYAYTDAESGTNVLDPDFRKVVAAGDPLINIPEHQANVLLFKDFDVSGRQLTFGAGVQYVSERLGETGTDFFLPSYTLAKLLASYEVIDNLTIHGEVTNLTDEEYYPASFSTLWVAAGAPLQFQVRAIYDF
jgi:iron complex outermembrane receptor protein